MTISRCIHPSRLLGFALATLWVGLAAAQPDPPEHPPQNPSLVRRPSVCVKPEGQGITGYKVPGRKSDSDVPWEMFLGNASHRLIAYIYRTRHPTNLVFYNTKPIKHILQELNIGNWQFLSNSDRELRPDLTDGTLRAVFEIKPFNETGLQDGLHEIEVYLRALNQTLPPRSRFSAGKHFEGEILVQFAQGQYIWHLEWCTNSPGVTQYRWTRSQERADSAVAAYQAEQWVEISEQEMKRYGGWVAQAVEDMVDRRERLTTLSGAIGVAIDIVGEVALFVISNRSPQDAPSQPTGKILPFPARPLPTTSPVRMPKASGM